MESQPMSTQLPTTRPTTTQLPTTQPPIAQPPTTQSPTITWFGKWDGRHQDCSKILQKNIQQ